MTVFRTEIISAIEMITRPNAVSSMVEAMRPTGSLSCIICDSQVGPNHKYAPFFTMITSDTDISMVAICCDCCTEYWENLLPTVLKSLEEKNIIRNIRVLNISTQSGKA